MRADGVLDVHRSHLWCLAYTDAERRRVELVQCESAADLVERSRDALPPWAARVSGDLRLFFEDLSDEGSPVVDAAFELFTRSSGGAVSLSYEVYSAPDDLRMQWVRVGVPFGLCPSPDDALSEAMASGDVEAAVNASCDLGWQA